MSYFNMVCDSCGREVYGCNIVNGMKFCAKCYQETFGETDKDRKIAELKKQLKTQPVEIVEKIKDLAEKMPHSPTEEPYMWLVGKSDFEQILKEYQK